VLGHVKSNKPVDALTSLLEDANERARVQAAEALGKIADTRAVEPLTRTLVSDSNTAVRISIAHALGKIGDSRAVPALAKALKDRDIAVYRAVVKALAKLGGEGAFEPLLEASRNRKERADYLPDALCRTGGEKAIAYIIRLFDNKEYAGDPDTGPDSENVAISTLLRFGETAVKPLLEAARSLNASKRACALLTLGLLREEKAFELLLEALKDKNSAVRAATAEAISLYRDARAVKPLIALLADRQEYVAVCAAQSLGRIGDRRALKPLVEVLLDHPCEGEDECSKLRIRTALALGAIGIDAAIEPLVLALLEDAYGLPQVAAQALGNFKDNRATDALIKALDDGNPEVVQAAVLSLGEIGDKRAVAPLLKKLQRVPAGYELDVYYPLWTLQKLRDPESADFLVSVLQATEDPLALFKGEAALALGEIGDRRTIEPLKKLLETDDITDRACAAVALAKLGDKDGADILKKMLHDKEEANYGARALSQSPDTRALPWLLNMLKENLHGRTYAVRALGKIGDKRASNTLTSLLQDKDEYVREAAIEALQELKEERAVTPLIEVLACDPDDDVRQAAHDALHEITGQNFGWNWQAWRRWLKERERQEPEPPRK
jgi:HEAT repeat protein